MEISPANILSLAGKFLTGNNRIPTSEQIRQREDELTDHGRLVITGIVNPKCCRCKGVGAVDKPTGQLYCSCVASLAVNSR